MFKFVINKKNRPQNIDVIVNSLEKKYNIKFPEVLKDYYLKHDNEMIELCVIKKGKKTFGVEEMVPLSGNGFTFEKIKDGDLADGFISKTMNPLAVNGGGDFYYWDSITGNVSIVYSDQIENPIEICDSVEDFLALLNDCIN